MSDYIKRSDAIDKYCDLCGVLTNKTCKYGAGLCAYYDACIYVDELKRIPCADAAEVVHGEWIGYNADKGSDWLRFDGEPIFLVCNKCHGMVMNNASLHWNFCPNCGAKMDGNRKDEPQTCEECEYWNDTEDGCADRHGCMTEPQTENGIGCSRCEGRYDCLDRDMPHAVHCNNWGKITDEPQTERSEDD